MKIKKIILWIIPCVILIIIIKSFGYFEGVPVYFQDVDSVIKMNNHYYKAEFEKDEEDSFRWVIPESNANNLKLIGIINSQLGSYKLYKTPEDMYTILLRSTNR
jgi:hypothetical protein